MIDFLYIFFLSKKWVEAHVQEEYMVLLYRTQI